jgi:hypothetical protein
MPRKLTLEELVKVLVSEHQAMKEGLSRVRRAAHAGDFAQAGAELVKVEETFRKHIEDEESSILRALIGAYGVEGAEEEIRVFQQHRPIYRLMEELTELASMGPPELEKAQDRLNELMGTHTLSEETKVFPRALQTEGSVGVG